MNVRNNQAQVTSRSARRTTVATTVLLLLASAAHAGPAEQAKRIYERIVGIDPGSAAADQAVVAQMTSTIAAACPNGCAASTPPNPALVQAASLATQQANFYNVVVKNMVTPWSNRDQTVFAPLNDYTATVIGMVRDDVAFNTALSADILYTINAPGLPAPSNASNAHYATAETNGVDLSTTLKQATQSGT